VTVVPGRPGANLGSSGRKCPLDRAQMLARLGAYVGSSGRICWLDWAQMLARLGADVAEPAEHRVRNRLLRRGEGCRAPYTVDRRCFLVRSRLHLRPLDRTFLPARRYFLARSRLRSCALGGDPTSGSLRTASASATPHMPREREPTDPQARTRRGQPPRFQVPGAAYTPFSRRRPECSVACEKPLTPHSLANSTTSKFGSR
jgi:hypothetical protein